MNLKTVFLNVALILAVALGSVFAQTRTITFYAYGISMPGITQGHAFVQFDDRGTFGFYPINDFRERVIGAVWGDVGSGVWGRVIGEGEIRPDWQYMARARNDGTVKNFQVNEAQFQAAYNVYLRWRNNPGTYVIGSRDCINFVYEVADAIGLWHDAYRRDATVWPMSAVNSIFATSLHKGIYQISGESNYTRVFPNYTYNARQRIYVPQEGSYVFEVNNCNNNRIAISVGRIRGNEIHYEDVWIAGDFGTQEGYRVGASRIGTLINSSSWNNYKGSLWVWSRSIP